jgi:putative endonuclease
MPPTPARALGDRGEEAAFGHLARLGYRILARNVRCGAHGELDGVALDGRTLCFVEVKSASADSPVAPEEHVTPDKKKALLRAARHYLRAQGMDETTVETRVDVVTVRLGDGPPSIQVYPGAL